MFNTHGFYITQPLHTSMILPVVLSARIGAFSSQVFGFRRFLGLDPACCADLSCMVREKQGLFLDLLALKLTRDVS